MNLDFNEVIHAERGRLLAALPKGAQTVCSAGCAGGWYFDWFESQYGPVERHYGVELYLEKPRDLPGNVVWITNSVSDMCDVPTGSVDLLFSGQNIEHLYYEDLLGFLLEASRVVGTDGYLCVDSPNRLVTQELGYIQPQHVLELSREDIARLVEAAGFEIISTNGIWSCTRDGRSYADVTTLTDDAAYRRDDAHDRPDEAFIWWLLARKKNAANPSQLTSVVEEIAASRFSPFVAARFRKGIGKVQGIEGTETILSVSEADHGPVFFGPYVPLRKGHYVAQFLVKFLDAAGCLSASVTCDLGRKTLVRHEIQASNIGEWSSLELEFVVEDFTDGIETPVLAHGTNALVRLGTSILRK